MPHLWHRTLSLDALDKESITSEKCQKPPMLHVPGPHNNASTVAKCILSVGRGVTVGKTQSTANSFRLSPMHVATLKPILDK